MNGKIAPFTGGAFYWMPKSTTALSPYFRANISQTGYFLYVMGFLLESCEYEYVCKLFCGLDPTFPLLAYTRFVFQIFLFFFFSVNSNSKLKISLPYHQDYFLIHDQMINCFPKNLFLSLVVNISQ